MTSLFNISRDQKNPVLDIGDRVGDTNFIDFIDPRELSAPVMHGVDCQKRPFVVMRGTVSVNGNTTPWMQTFFQRYYGHPHMWTGCGNGNELMDTDGGLCEDQVEDLCQLLRSGSVVVSASVSRIRVARHLENAMASVSIV